MTNPTPHQVKAGCKHFNGMLNTHCEAGIAYNTMRYPYPCYHVDESQWRGGTPVVCPLFEYHTEEELEAKDQEVGRLALAFFTSLANDKCPHCGAEIKAKEQIGRCVYAAPCGHRLYQGKLKKGKD